MHRTQRVTIGGLIIAAAFIFPPSSGSLQANITEGNAQAAHKEQGFILADSSRDTFPATASAEKSPNAPAIEKGTRFMSSEGRASYYANRFHGRKTASGEDFDRTDYTAAHRSLPFGTKVRVTNLANGRHVVVKINDRGPHTKGRIIDISQAAAREIGMTGVGNVRIEAYD